MAIAERRIEDDNLVRAVAALTPEKIKAAFEQVTKNEAGARLKVYYDTCLRCGMCAEACHFSMSHPGDPSYTPIGKMEQTMWRL
ncbi:(Fe-S)-binding protein, partial [Desulfovibrio sp. OttesenSCG-928-F20]|nr:(Fe-S)-binding protein [Desulfovibrio sp. OttesenSCG-928-F20]